MHRERYMFSGTLLVLLLVVLIPGDTPHNSPFHLPVPMVRTWLSVQPIFEFIMLALLAATYYIHVLTSKRWELYSYIWINRLFLFQWSYRSSEWWHMGTGRSVAPRRLQPEHTASGELGVSTSLYPCVSFLWFWMITSFHLTFPTLPAICISLYVRKATLYKKLYIH